MRKLKEALEVCFVGLCAIISIPLGLLLMLAVLAIPIAGIGLGIAVSIKMISWVTGWPA